MGALQARAKYLSVARQMKFFEDQRYEEWRQNVEQHLPSLLKRNLLIKPHHAAEEMRAAAQKEADEAGMCLTLKTGVTFHFLFGKGCL